MQRLGNRIIFSPTDLNHFLECHHLVQLDRARQDGAARGPRDAHAALLAEKGAEHERAWLERFRAGGRRIVEIQSTDRDWDRTARETIQAMQAAADVIYQGVFVDDDWHGIADFLVRVPQPSMLGNWSYEAWDAKLARTTKAYFVLQLCFYSEQLDRIQGTPPEAMYVVLGTGEQRRLRYRDYAAYYRAIRKRFLSAAHSNRRTYPYPVTHCALCDYHASCQQYWREHDHLSQVAGIRRQQVERLNEAGVQTVAHLAALHSGGRVGIGLLTLDRLRDQARLQAEFRHTGTHRYELLPAASDNGFRLLPAPSEGDVFFDMEGDPYFAAEGGLEYLFGAMTVDEGHPVFRRFLALDRAEEKIAFEQFVDFLRDRLLRWPDLHVYHYASYETTALKRLMSQHATREDAIDDLLRREVFVDLYRVVRQSIRISHPSYSIKKVRSFFMTGAGEGAVAEGGDSILEFERWRRIGDERILQNIVDYNEEDCLSTVGLRDWLLDRRLEAERGSGASIPWKAAKEGALTPERVQEDDEIRSRREWLQAHPGSSEDILGHLLNYHRREGKPEWWAYFDRQKKSLDELLDDTEAIALLETATQGPPERDKKSLIHTLSFPAQEFKLDAGDAVEDPFTGKNAGTIVWMDAAAGTLRLKRGPTLTDVPLPRAVVRGEPRSTIEQRKALCRVADAIRAGSADFAAARAILGRDLPRFEGRDPGIRLQTAGFDDQAALVESLDQSCLFVQGPPGSGKTWTGARLIVWLLTRGKRIGVAATSHKAIHNLLFAIEEVATAQGVPFDGLKKSTKGDEGTEFDGPSFVNCDDPRECEASGAQLIAGTSWLFAREGMHQQLDYLFIDEAGQMSLADAVATATAARNVVLLGDPQQLPHVTQGVHPAGSGRSVLEHLLGDSPTVPEDRGLFLARSWRMHPLICNFVSRLAYEGRLASASGCERQRIDSAGLAGAGLRHLAVEHSGNMQQSPEEAAAIAREIAILLSGALVTGRNGSTRPLTPADILVVAPYNMQVRNLREVLPEGVEVGTVDKFQGREAPVVFFSMASSSGEDVPRGLEFLFNRNRFNVAVSRAQCLSVVVCSPSLLESRCRTVEQMQLVNALCDFAENARTQHAPPSGSL